MVVSQMAKQLLASGASVTSAAVACGYENISYLTRIFKKRFGCTPSTCIPKNKIMKSIIKQVENSPKT